MEKRGFELGLCVQGRRFYQSNQSPMAEGEGVEPSSLPMAGISKSRCPPGRHPPWSPLFDSNERPSHPKPDAHQTELNGDYKSTADPTESRAPRESHDHHRNAIRLRTTCQWQTLTRLTADLGYTAGGAACADRVEDQNG